MPRERRPKLYKPYFITPSTDELHRGNINPVTLQHPGTSTAKRWGKWSLILIWDYKCPETSNQPREDSNLGWVVVSKSKPPDIANMSIWLYSGGGGEVWGNSLGILFRGDGLPQLAFWQLLASYSFRCQCWLVFPSFWRLVAIRSVVVATLFTIWISLHF